MTAAARRLPEPAVTGPGRHKSTLPYLIALLVPLLLGVQPPAHGNEVEAVIVGPEETPSGPYQIVEIHFDATGPSRDRPLLLVSGLTEDAVLRDAADLEQTLARARQDLMNRRVFDEIIVTWAIAEPLIEETPPEDWDPDDPVAVRVTFAVDDGWTLLPVPFYRYNSNSGHNPFVVLYWDNIAGTLTDFGLSTGYYSRDWTTPFRWDVRLDWRRVRMLGRSWNFSFDQVFATTEQATAAGNVELAYSGYSTTAGVSTSFRLTDWLRYSIRPNIGVNYGYETIENRIGAAIPEDRASVGFSHSLGTGRVDWIDNLRRGWGASLSNGLSYAPAEGEWSAGLGASWSGHWLPVQWLSPGLRLRVDHNLFGDSLNRGGVVRGVADNRIWGQTLVAGNAQVTVRALNIERFAQFHLVPFLDAAVVRKEGRRLTGDDVAVGIGFDVLAFPDFIRGFEARMSLGWDVREVFSGGGGIAAEFFLTESLQF